MRPLRVRRFRHLVIRYDRTEPTLLLLLLLLLIAVTFIKLRPLRQAIEL